MSNGEVRGRLKCERKFQIKKFKSVRIEKSPEEENLPFEKEKKLLNAGGNPRFASILLRTSTIKYCSNSSTLAKLVINYVYKEKRKDKREVYGTLKNLLFYT
jgi:hypothetical protein